MSRSSTSRGHASLPLWVALAATVLHMFFAWPYTVDDVFISLRYGDNWIRGLGLVMNGGDYVKGYSNLSYTLLLGLLSGAGLPSVTVGKVLGVLASCVVLYGTDRHLRAGPCAHPMVRGATLLLLATSAPWIIWSVAGLETPLYGAAITLGVLARLREQEAGGRPWSAGLFAFAVLTRPEGIGLFGAVAAHDLVVHLRRKSMKRDDWLWLAIPIAAYLGELGWSQLYYGDPLPNTHLAKVAPSVRDVQDLVERYIAPVLRLEGYMFDGMVRVAGPWFLAMTPLALLLRGRRRQASMFLAVVLAQFAFVGYAGGDWMPAYRFVAPVMPLVVLLWAEVVCGAVRVTSAPAGLAVVPLLGMLALAVGPNMGLTRSVVDRKPVDGGVHQSIGRAYGALAEPGRTLASFDVGGIGWASNMEIVDTAGLTDRQIAASRHLPREQYWPHLARYAESRGLDILRRHPGGKGSPIHNPMRDSGLFLESPDRRILIRRALVLPRELPSHARPLVLPRSPPRTHVLGLRIPTVVLADSRVCGFLYWTRSKDAEPFQTRALRATTGPTSIAINSSRSLWNRFGTDAPWAAGELFADYLCFRAPPTAGDYTMTALTRSEAPDRNVPGWPMTVIEPESGPEYARTLHGSSIADLESLRHALTLADLPPLRDDYVTAAIEASREARASAPDRLTGLHRAKFVLSRAYYDLNGAPGPLRRELDEVEALRRGAIRDALQVPHREP